MVDPEERWFTDRLLIEPLTRAHAIELYAGLDDPALHEYIGGEPLSLLALTERFTRWETRHSPDGSQTWSNWLIRERATGAAIGTLQATAPASGPSAGAAEIAWVLIRTAQKRGYASEAAASLADRFAANGWTTVAYIHPEHVASQRVAGAAGLAPTDIWLDGERRWQRSP